MSKFQKSMVVMLDTTNVFGELIRWIADGNRVYAPVLVAVEEYVNNDFGDLTGETTMMGEGSDWAKALDHSVMDSACRFIWKNDYHGGLDRTCLIGRSRDASFRIKHESVSSSHAMISLSHKKNSYVIEDCGSKNKTKLNGEILLPQLKTPLWSGVYLAFGESTHMFFDPPGLSDIAGMLENPL